MLLQRVFVDANVLASRTLRDWLCLLRTETDAGCPSFADRVDQHLRALSGVESR